MNRFEARARRRAVLDAFTASERPALVVNARMAGLPAHAIAQYLALPEKEQFSHRRLFARWVEFYEGMAHPRPATMPEGWLDWNRVRFRPPPTPNTKETQ